MYGVYNNNKLTVINLCAGPGAGKSTTAAGLFHLMKLRQMEVELVTEYAKDLVWENRHSLFIEQDYIFAKQHRRVRRLVEHGIEYCITDSPLFLGLAYMPEDYYKSFEPLVLEVFNSFNNINFMITRTKAYNPKGRNQTADEAKEKDDIVNHMLNKYRIPYTCVNGDSHAPELILNHILSIRK